MKVRIVYKSDKTIAIIRPAPKSKRRDESIEQWIERVLSKGMQGELEGLLYDDINISDLPQDRKDRNAWRGEKGQDIWIDQNVVQQLQTEKENKGKIDNKIRQMAIERLITAGELPSTYL